MIDDGNVPVQAFWWDGTQVRYLDQRELPERSIQARAATAHAIVTALETGQVDGARCRDLFGACGVALALRDGSSREEMARWIGRIRATVVDAVPTPAIDRVAAAMPQNAVDEARRCLDEQHRIDESIVAFVGDVLPSAGTIVTHGYTGPLDTGARGTALPAIVAAHRAGKRLQVIVTEGRPADTGARLTVPVLRQAGIDCELVCDAAVAPLLRDRPVAAIVTGAASVAVNGDACADLGTYGLALAAAAHRVPLYVTVPRLAVVRSLPATVATPPTRDVQRSTPPARTAPLRCFDVTPGRFIAGFITEYGLLRPPYDAAIATLAARPDFIFLSRRAALNE